VIILCSLNKYCHGIDGPLRAFGEVRFHAKLRLAERERTRKQCLIFSATPFAGEELAIKSDEASLAFNRQQVKVR
jgi:hypothetical protein